MAWPVCDWSLTNTVPSLSQVCVINIVNNIKYLCYGVNFDELSKFKYILGPFEYTSSRCIEMIFEYVIATKQLNSSWLALLVVTHLRTIDLRQYPGGVSPQLFKLLIDRCQLLERLIIPNCKKIPNKTLCQLLAQSPSLLHLDLSNKTNPKIDPQVLDTLSQYCRCLTTLKLSDYRLDDPNTLLVLVGKKYTGQQLLLESPSEMSKERCGICGREKLGANKDVCSPSNHCHCLEINQSTPASDEEMQNQQALAVNSDEEDLYETDGSLTVLTVTDHSTEFGCLNLDTLWLDNVNVTDQVLAVLLQSLPRLRNLNLSYTDICNPWRLLDAQACKHLIELEQLDIRSTALSKTALELIPVFHPDLFRFSISSNSLPPYSYAPIGKLTGVSDLELIGGQFYPTKPEKIFSLGILPVITAIGKNLRLLDLRYIINIEFNLIPGNCPLLEELDLSNTSVTFHYPCRSLGEYCPLLTKLNLSYCRTEAFKGSFEDPVRIERTKALENMIGCCSKITKLDLSGTSVNDETLQSIFSNPTHPLQVLDLSYCVVASIEGVEHIWAKCSSLRKINITFCRAISVDNKNKFEKKCFAERPVFKSHGKLIWR